jgi:AcrR family transcriptional regulator
VKERLISAAKKLIETKGLSAVSTREIAREAGCAEGTLYNHFKNISDLLLAVFLESLPSFSESLTALAFRVGEGQVRETLTDAFVQALAFYRQTMPLMGALFSDPNLLSKYQQALEDTKRGPHIPLNYLIAYLKAEQRLGRVRSDLNPTLFAELFLGSAFQRVFREKFAGPAPNTSVSSASEDEHVARDIVQFFVERIVLP